MEPNFKIDLNYFQSKLIKFCLIFNPIPFVLYLFYKLQFGQIQEYLTAFSEFFEEIVAKQHFDKKSFYLTIKISVGCFSGIALLILYQIWTFGSI